MSTPVVPSATSLEDVPPSAAADHTQSAVRPTSTQSSDTRQNIPDSSISSLQGGDPGGQNDRVRSAGDVWAAVVLTWQNQKRHLFTSWVHVPLGVMFLLTVTWGFRLAINIAPFRFPAPVIAMIMFFGVLLLLDVLSDLFPGQQQKDDVEKDAAVIVKQDNKKKRFVDPFMSLLAPPCEFLLRNMSVMFTPSFVLIPAREVIPGREIGLLAAWFAVSQVIGFVFPVLFIRLSDWVTKKSKIILTKAEKQRSPSPSQYEGTPSRRASLATISGVDWEKGMSFSGGQKLGTVATGLSGLTANVIAPISHLPMDIDADAWRHIESTALELARQQGDPAVTGYQNNKPSHFVYRDYSPRSDVSSFRHDQHQCLQAGQHSYESSSRPRKVGRASSRRVARSRSRSPMSKGGVRKRSESTPPSLAEYRFPFTTPYTLDDADNAHLAIPPASLQVDPLSHFSVFPGVTTVKKAPPIADILEEDKPYSGRISDLHSDAETRRPSRVSFEASVKNIPKFTIGMPEIQEKRADGASVAASDRATGQTAGQDVSDAASSCGSTEGDAIERLSSWMSDLITPTIYFLLFLAGLPLYFVADIALPLFLGVNILTFVAAITIVPPKIRRFLHPILSCSIATVFIIWAFAAMKGISIKDCLNQYYSIDTRYSDLWALQAYQGRIPGAGDVLFSTLDAGIVALAVPMYRYRKELKENIVRMMTVLVPCATLSLFFFNWIAALMGLDEVRSLAFTARFMSTPLAIELAANIGADESITVILVVITGILAAIFKDQFFRLMKVNRDDYIIIGITMGSTAGAIGASSLISTPRVMAVASLSFVIFGSILLIATAIPPVVDIVRMLA
ncbi:hypothetical protein CBS101457_004364 [Exobasidium rhododendri]|nr:hypothetical protein CBS101457_004364 [Exobasidium rhododendri]